MTIPEHECDDDKGGPPHRHCFNYVGPFVIGTPGMTPT